MQQKEKKEMEKMKNQSKWRSRTKRKILKKYKGKENKNLKQGNGDHEQKMEMKIYKEEKKSTQENANSFDSPSSLRKKRKMNRRNLSRGTREDPGTNTRKMQNE